jgi:hypothetical protein
VATSNLECLRTGSTEPTNDAHRVLDEALLQRVYSEFLEMPGLRLTCQQAQRLWGLDERTCLTLLEFLVDAKFLCRPGHGMYTRLTDGHVYPRPRTAKARIVDEVAHRKEEAV